MSNTAKIIITGGTSGLGAAVVRAFADIGATVCFCGIVDAEGEALASELTSQDNPILYFNADVRSESQLATFHQQSIRKMGGLTAAFNNAGISHHADKMADLRPAMVEDLWRTNVMGVWHAMRHQIPHMQKSDGGAIINTASILSCEGAEWMSAYGMSKHALVGLSVSAAMDYKDDNIRINTISPGPMKTPMLDRALADIDGDMSKFAGGFPDGGPADPAIVAKLVVSLTQHEQRHITGQNILLKGDGTPREDIKTL